MNRNSLARIVAAGIYSALFFVSALPVFAATPTTLFSDGFESSSYAAWDAPGGTNYALSGGTCRKGPDSNLVAIKITGASTPHAQVLKKSFSTAGYENIRVSFCFKWDVIENGDIAVVEYTTDGTTWQTVKTIDNTTVDHMMYAADNTEIATSNGVGQIPTPFTVTQDELEGHGIMLPADAANKPNFALRIREQLTDGNDFIWIDDIRVTGTAIVVVPPPPPPAPVNLIPNPSVETPGSPSSVPLNWAKGGWGSNVRTLTYPVAGQDGASAVKVEISSYTNGDAKWYFDDVPVTPGETYTFSDWYMSSVTSYVALRYKKTDGTFQYVDLTQVGASATWQNIKRDFVVPANVVSVTVFHIINKIGYLTTDTFSIKPLNVGVPFNQGMVSFTFDDGWESIYQNGVPILDAAGLKSTQFVVSGILDTPSYMNMSEVLAMQAAGHEIGAHTKTHTDLTALSSADLATEVGGSRRDLSRAGVAPLTVFAYPEGEYTTSVEEVVHSSGFVGARSVDHGFNLKDTDRYALKVFPVVSTSTPAQINALVDEAVANKKWLILVFHQIDHSGAAFGTTPEIVQQIVDHVTVTSTPVVTLSQGLALMNAGMPLIADTTAPTITLVGPSTVEQGVGTSYTDAGATAFDNIDGDLTSAVVVGGDVVNTNTIGTYHVRYNVSDLAGNPATEVVRTVNVVPPQTASNLVPNASVETPGANPALPLNWFKGGWGTNTRTLTYPVSGHNSPSAVKVDISSYTNGDAKWYFSDVPVTAGQTYALSEWYMSNVPTYVGLRYTMTGGGFSYADVASASASPSGWQNVSATFTVPPNVVSLTVFHVINQVGYLTMDDLSLTTEAPVPPSNNSIINPSVETASPTDVTLPQGWHTGRWGTNTTSFTYPVTGIAGSKAMKIDVTSYSSGDAKWYFDDVAADPSVSYTFSDKYISTVPTEPTVRFTLSGGGYQYMTLATLPAAPVGATFTATFTPPPTAVGMTVFHVITGVGSLTTDDFSITH